MNFYHGSKDANLTTLYCDYNSFKKVYVTNDKLTALIYASREFPNLFYQVKDGTVIFNEIVPNLFNKMFSNKTCYIYTAENLEYSPVSQGNHCAMQNCFSINKDVKLISKETIIDCEKELLKYAKSKKLIIRKANEMSIEEITSIIKGISVLKDYDESKLRGKKNYTSYILSNKHIKSILTNINRQ